MNVIVVLMGICLVFTILFVFLGVFDLTVAVDSLMFVGSQLVGLSYTGKIGVWNVMTQNWRVS